MKALLERALDVIDYPEIFLDKAKSVLFVGDLHGDPTAIDLAGAFLEAGGERVVFLGDYADRGLHQRETIRKLLELVLEHGKRVVLLRGNHEVGPFGERYVGPVLPFDVSFHLSPEELSLYLSLHLRLSLVYYNPSIGVVAVHGFLPTHVLEKLPRVHIDPFLEKLIVWSDSEPEETELRGVEVDDPSAWRSQAVETVLERLGLTLLKGHSPQELGLRRRRIVVLFAHCLDTGGYYGEGVRYALHLGGWHIAESVPCGSHREVVQRLKNIFL